MTETHAAHPYARALYEIAAAQGLDERIGHDLALVRLLWEEDPQITQPFLAHPMVRTTVKESVLAQALGSSVHRHTLSLLRLLVRRGKAMLIPSLAAAFFREREEDGRACHVTARTARSLLPEERATLQRRLTAALGKPVTIEEVLTPDLLAGVELAVAGSRVEGSLRGRLEELALQLGGRR